MTITRVQLLYIQYMLTMLTMLIDFVYSLGNIHTLNMHNALTHLHMRVCVCMRKAIESRKITMFNFLRCSFKSCSHFKVKCFVQCKYYANMRGKLELILHCHRDIPFYEIININLVNT